MRMPPMRLWPNATFLPSAGGQLLETGRDGVDFRDFFQTVHSRRLGPAATTCDHFPNDDIGPAEQRLDGAIGTVADPTAHTHSPRLIGRPATEPDALHATVDANPDRC